MDKSNYYNKIAPIYDRTRWMTESVAEEVADFILALIDAKPETSFLEPGVGTGLNVLPFVKRGYAVAGMDVSQEMLDRFCQKLPEIPQNLQLIHGDASLLPFAVASFDVVLTVHMVHTVKNWKTFLDEIDRVLKPQGFYLNAQWITPPARMEFERYFRRILAKHEAVQTSQQIDTAIAEINVDEYFQNKGYRSTYAIAKKWIVSNTVAELLGFFKARAYGICWRVSEPICDRVMAEFEEFCLEHYGSLDAELSSEAKFEIWAYSVS